MKKIPALLAAVALAAGSLVVAAPAQAAAVCNITKTSGGYGYQATCSTAATGTQFKIITGCSVVMFGPTIYTRHGSWQTQGGNRVSAGRCDSHHFTTYGSVQFR